MTPNKDPWFRNRLIRDAIHVAIHEEMLERPVYILGEGAHMKVHFDAPAIKRDFADRVVTLPISEDGNTNFAVGLALGGLVPIVDVISSDFLFRTMDAICNTAAKLACYGSPRTLLVRAEFLTGGPTAGQRIEGLFARIPGLRVSVPASPRDAYHATRAALRHPGVTLLFEDRMIADAEIPEAERSWALPEPKPWKARVLQTGKRGTVVTYGLGRPAVVAALGGEDFTLIDLRHLFPLDIETIDQHLEGNRLLVVEPDAKFMGVGSEIVAEICERNHHVLSRRLGGPRVTIPACRELHPHLFPSVETIRQVATELCPERT